MKHVFAHIVALLALSAIAVCYGGAAYHSAAMADEPEATPTPEPVAIVEVTMEATPAPTPMRRPQTVVYDYQIGQKAIEAVARGMYGLDTAQEKMAFAFLIVNRLFCYETRGDGKYLFARDIAGIVAQAGEFDFYDPDAPVTDENRDLAELGLNAQMTFIMTKKYTGYVFPSNLLYLGWEDGELCFYTERGAEPWYYGGEK